MVVEERVGAMDDLIQEDLSSLTDEELENSTMTLLHFRRLAKEQDERQKTTTLFDNEMEDLNQKMFSHKRCIPNV